MNSEFFQAVVWSFNGSWFLRLSFLSSNAVSFSQLALSKEDLDVWPALRVRRLPVDWIQTHDQFSHQPRVLLEVLASLRRVCPITG